VPKEIESSLAESAAALAGSGFLSLLDKEIAAAILASGERQRLAAGQVLFRQGEAGDSAFIVLEGELDVRVAVGVEQVQLARLRPHQLVGEIAVFARLPRTATVVAATDATLLRLRRDQVIAVVERHPQAGLAIIADLGKRLATVNTPLAFLSTATHLLRTETVDAEALIAMAASVPELGPFAQTFADMVNEIKVKQERQQDMAIAAGIQQSLLPAAFDPSGRAFAIHAFLRPTREVGGDLYDYFMIDDRHLAFVVADVSGKGVSAALFMVMLRSLVRALAMPGVEPDRLLERANATLVEQNDACMFVTVLLCILDIATGRLVFVNAGHNQGYRLSANGGWQELVANGVALGISPKARYAAQTIDLAPGDLIVLYTDGVTEAFSTAEEQFGEARLEALLKGLPSRAVDDVVGEIVAAVDAFAAGHGQSDDITCLALAFGAPR
jgi:serine phosphatase RsbU (regulator of sigma subunit)